MKNDVDPAGRTIDTGLVVALDTNVTPELHAEGVTRDLVRAVQTARQDAGFDVTTNVVTIIGATGEMELPLQTKEQTAAAILDQVEQLMRARADAPLPA